METRGSQIKKAVAIVGANGYAGLELARILLKHTSAELNAYSVREESWKLHQALGDKKAVQIPNLKSSELIALSKHFNAVFLATPTEVSLELAPLLTPHTHVIDLSGAFRLSRSEFENFYQLEHSSSELLAQARYGLLPWNTSTTTALTANPGCYATSCLMALIPLLKHQLIEPRAIVIDAKSGTTGAGRKAKEDLLFSEVEGECLPYKVGEHQHLPEIKKYADQFSESETDIQFTTNLLPIRRGIISSLYLRRCPPFASISDTAFMARMQAAFEQAYAGQPLVRFGSVDSSPELLRLRSVVGSPRTHLSYAVKGDKIFVFSCIDNLLKGAASQAVENWNAHNSWPTSTGLEEIEGIL